jgi:dUTP pyrophosphatase
MSDESTKEFLSGVSDRMNEAFSVMTEKANLRGTSNLDDQGVRGVLGRMVHDKGVRIKRWLEVGGEDFSDVRDDILDTINYAAIALFMGDTKRGSSSSLSASGLPLVTHGDFEKAHDTDAGWDIYTSEDVMVPPHTHSNVPSGTRMVPPPGTWLFLVGRSSTWSKHKLMVIPGVIDAGFSGELFAMVHNPTDQAVFLPKGSRVVQAIPIPLPTLPVRKGSMEEVQAAAERYGERGSKGFGSSGT